MLTKQFVVVARCGCDGGLLLMNAEKADAVPDTVGWFGGSIVHRGDRKSCEDYMLADLIFGENATEQPPLPGKASGQGAD